MAIVKLSIDWWSGFVPVAPEGCQIIVQKKLHQFPQTMQVLIPVESWSHPAGVRCYYHILDEQGNLLDVQHGNCNNGNMNCLFDGDDEAHLNDEYDRLVAAIPEVKEAVDNLLFQMTGRWYKTYESAKYLKLDYHKVSV